LGQPLVVTYIISCHVCDEENIDNSIAGSTWFVSEDTFEYIKDYLGEPTGSVMGQGDNQVIIMHGEG